MGSNKAITKEQQEQLSQFPIGRKLMEDLNKLKGEKIADSYSSTKIKVVAGDTLTQLAKKHKTTVAQLKKWNDIKNVNSIKEGQSLIVAKE